LREEDNAERASDREALAVRGERRGRRGDRLAGLLRAGRDDAELVSAQAVRAAVGRDRDPEALGELGQ
jgi:hypothetical protein